MKRNAKSIGILCKVSGTNRNAAKAMPPMTIDPRRLLPRVEAIPLRSRVPTCFSREKYKTITKRIAATFVTAGSAKKPRELF